MHLTVQKFQLTVLCSAKSDSWALILIRWLNIFQAAQSMYRNMLNIN